MKLALEQKIPIDHDWQCWHESSGWIAKNMGWFIQILCL